MASLKGGSKAEFTDSMAEAIETAFAKEWKAAKGTDAPADEADGRKVMWCAIANGVLNYLQAHQNELVTSVTLDTNAAQKVTALELNISA